MSEILTISTAVFMLHLFWSSLGWGVIIQFIFQHVAGWFGYTPPAIPAGGVTRFSHVVWRMPVGIEWFTEIFYMANAVGSVLMFMSDPTYSAMHSIVWDSYFIGVIIILVVGICCELFPWLEQRTNHITANIGVNLCLGILFYLLFPGPGKEHKIYSGRGTPLPLFLLSKKNSSHTPLLRKSLTSTRKQQLFSSSLAPPFRRGVPRRGGGLLFSSHCSPLYESNNTFPPLIALPFRRARCPWGRGGRRPEGLLFFTSS